MTSPCATTLRSTLQRQEGSALIELAVVLPVLLLMVFGFINTALVMYGICNATFATRKAIRYASLHSSTSYQPTTTQDITNIINPFLVPYPQNTPTITLSYGAGNHVGSTVTVNLNQTYYIAIPFMPGGSFSLYETATGVIVQ